MRLPARRPRQKLQEIATIHDWRIYHDASARAHRTLGRLIDWLNPGPPAHQTELAIEIPSSAAQRAGPKVGSLESWFQSCCYALREFDHGERIRENITG